MTFCQVVTAIVIVLLCTITVYYHQTFLVSLQACCMFFHIRPGFGNRVLFPLNCSMLFSQTLTCLCHIFRLEGWWRTPLHYSITGHFLMRGGMIQCIISNTIIQCVSNHFSITFYEYLEAVYRSVYILCPCCVCSFTENNTPIGMMNNFPKKPKRFQ